MAACVLQSSSLASILMELGSSAIPANISKTVRNNAGGAWNHLLYFKVMICHLFTAAYSAAHAM